MRNRRDTTSRSFARPFSFLRIGAPALVLGIIAALPCRPVDQLVRVTIGLDIVLLIALTWLVHRLLRERFA